MFRVEWIQAALDDLVRIWLTLDSAGRLAITDAAHLIDVQLADSADTAGESRSGNLRIHYIKPLGFTFEVDAAQGIARVANVWLVK
jgi:hypothetical protein